MIQRVALPLILTLFSVTSFADVLDAGGPTPDFATVAAAVAAAADGDVIRVHGNHSGFAIDDKDLRIVGIGGASITGTVRVRNLEAQRSVLLANLTVNAVGAAGLILYVNEGAVRVQNCVLNGAPNRWPGLHSLHCDDIALIDCTVQGGPNGGPAVLLEHTGATIHGGSYVGTDTMLISAGGDAIHGVFVDLYVAGATLVGGNGGAGLDADCDCDFPDPGGNGGNGVRWAGGSARILDNVILPGAGGPGGLCEQGFFGAPPGDPGFAFSDGTVVLDGNAPTASLPSLVVEATSPTLALTSGTPAEGVRIAISAQDGFRTLGNIRGPLLVDPPFTAIIAPGQTDATGNLGVPLSMPDLPDLGTAVLRIQPLFTDATGSLTLGPVRQVIVLDSAW